MRCWIDNTSLLYTPDVHFNINVPCLRKLHLVKYLIISSVLNKIIYIRFSMKFCKCSVNLLP